MEKLTKTTKVCAIKTKLLQTNPKEFSEKENKESQTTNEDWKFDYSNYLTACSWMDEEEFATM